MHQNNDKNDRTYTEWPRGKGYIVLKDTIWIATFSPSVFAVYDKQAEVCWPWRAASHHDTWTSG